MKHKSFLRVELIHSQLVGNKLAFFVKSSFPRGGYDSARLELIKVGRCSVECVSWARSFWVEVRGGAHQLFQALTLIPDPSKQILIDSSLKTIPTGQSSSQQLSHESRNSHGSPPDRESFNLDSCTNIAYKSSQIEVLPNAML